jgi:HD-like signal output (HDOD) protein
MSQVVQMMRALRSMPPLPDVAFRVLQIVRDPEYSIDTLVSVVRTDPALTTRILKLCNSSLFGLSREITTVSDAVAYIGTRNLVKLVLVTCTSGYFKSAKGSGFGDAATLWHHTLACATACQSLAEQSGYDQPATAYTAGILHNVGKVALSQVVDLELLNKIAGEPTAPGPDADWVARERALFGLDHAAAGGLVTESSNLPIELRRAVRHHHDPAQLQSDENLVALLHVADQTALQMGIGVVFPDMDYSISTLALEQLHLTDADIETLKAGVAEDLRRSAELLNLDGLPGR